MELESVYRGLLNILYKKNVMFAYIFTLSMVSVCTLQNGKCMHTMRLCLYSLRGKLFVAEFDHIWI